MNQASIRMVLHAWPGRPIPRWAAAALPSMLAFLLLFLAVPAAGQAGGHRVTGAVTTGDLGAAQTPVSAASVLVKGTTIAPSFGSRA